MLSTDELKQLTRTTRHYWNHFKHENYYVHQWAEAYTNKFEDIKNVFQSRSTGRAIKTILKTRRGFTKCLAIYNTIKAY